MIQDYETAVTIERICKRYADGTEANRDISLTIEQGEILTLLGPNGAGKTTLVRQITTELLPTSGDIRVLGRDPVSEPNEVKALLGVVPQDAGLYWDLSAEQHFHLLGKMRGLPGRRARERADELVESLGLEEHADKATQTLSGGLQRRVMIGIATCAEPPVLVLDEPTTSLDPQARRDLWALIREYRREGRTVLLTTHYMEEAEALSDRIGIILQGRLAALDSLPNLRAAYNLEFKISFRRDGAPDDEEEIFGTDDGELVERVRSMGVTEYSVSRATLEDVYLTLTERKGARNGNC